MKIQFVGDGNNDPDHVMIRGLKCPLGKSVTVPKDIEEELKEDRVAMARLQGNSHFKVTMGRAKKDG